MGPSREQLSRADRLTVRIGAWPHGARPGDSKGFCEAVAPLCLPLMFDKAEKLLDLGNGAAMYRFQTWEPVFNTVTLYSENWNWLVGDGSAQGRGLITLWAWRWDCGCTQAHMELMALHTLSQEAKKPRRQRKAA